MPRNERGQFTKADIYIPLPSWSGLYKILVISILIFPWYVILKNQDFSTALFSSMLGTDYCPKCPVCPDLPPSKPPKCPKRPNIRCLPCPSEENRANGANGMNGTNGTNVCPPCECECPE